MSFCKKLSFRLSNPPFLSDNDKITESLIEEHSISQDSINTDANFFNTVCYGRSNHLYLNELNDSASRNLSYIQKPFLEIYKRMEGKAEIGRMASERQEENVEVKQKGNYLLGKTLGEGAFGLVKCGTHITTGEKVAVKILDKTRMKEEEDDFNRVKKEINILKKLRHKNVIQLYEIIESQNKLYLVIELCEGKELFDYIVDNQKLSEAEACKLFQDLIDGVEYLHSQNIVHRDLKPENLLLDSERNLKITDFGLSTVYSNENLLTTPCGTPSYAPPEMLKGEEYHGLLSDIWSCGVILFAMLCGYLPFSESNEDINCRNIIEGNFEIPDYLSPGVVDLLANVLKIDPVERYDIQQVRQHTWFNLIAPQTCPGIVLEYHKIPIDKTLFSEILKEHFSIDNAKVISMCFESNKLIMSPDLQKEEQLDYEKICDLKNKIESNKFDNFTAIYYLTLKKQVKDGYNSISDLRSQEYINYINSTYCIKDEFLAEINKADKNESINGIPGNEAENAITQNYQNEMEMVCENESEYIYKDSARHRKSYFSTENLTHIKPPRESILSNRNRQIDAQINSLAGGSEGTLQEHIFVNTFEHNLETDRANEVYPDPEDNRYSVFSRGTLSGKINPCKHSDLGNHSTLPPFNHPRDSSKTEAKSSSSTTTAMKEDPRKLNAKLNKKAEPHKSNYLTTSKKNNDNKVKLVFNDHSQVKQLERKTNHTKQARHNKFTVQQTSSKNNNAQKYIEEDLYRLESVEKSPFKNRLKLKSDKGKYSAYIALDDAFPIGDKSRLAVNHSCSTNSKVKIGNSSSNTPILHVTRPKNGKYTKTITNQKKNACSFESDSQAKKYCRLAPNTTKSHCCRVNSVGTKQMSVSKCYPNEEIIRSSDCTIGESNKEFEKVSDQLGVSYVLCPYTTKRIQSNKFDLHSRKNKNKSLNFDDSNNMIKLTQYKPLETKDFKLSSKSKVGSSKIILQRSNEALPDLIMINPNAAPFLLNKFDSKKKVTSNAKKIKPKSMSLETVADLDCIVSQKLSLITFKFEDTLKVKRVTFVKLADYRYKCSKSGICFNCEILKLDQGNDSLLNTPLSHKKMLCILNTSNESFSGICNIDLDAKASHGIISNDYLEYGIKESEFTVPAKLGSEVEINRTNALDISNSLARSSQETASEAFSIFYLQFKYYSGDSAGYKQLMKGVLDLFNK